MALLRENGSCILALEDGTVFTGRHFGAEGTQTGEVVFNTSMTGYQEVLTDPSYYGQIVAMTYPHIGNYGINAEDVESSKPHVAGFVIKELSRRHSNYRSTMGLHEYLLQNNIIGIQGLDTRALTLKLRVEGALRGVLSTQVKDFAQCVRLAREGPSMVGADLVKAVAPRERSVWTEGLTPLFPPLLRGDEGGSPIGKRQSANGHPRVLAVDCGMKRNILRLLVDTGCEVSVVPPTVTAEEILQDKPDGVFVSNGPGDPAAVHYAIDMLKGIVGKVPIFGICLGHQLLGLALGAETFKLKFGHRGVNQPVRNLTTGRVEITSQNHGFAVSQESLESVGGVTTHVNLNDGTLEGFVHKDWPILAVQYHPEASPGPHDATYLFDCFARMMSTKRAPTGDDMAAAQAALQNRGRGS